MSDDEDAIALLESLESGFDEIPCPPNLSRLSDAKADVSDLVGNQGCSLTHGSDSGDNLFAPDVPTTKLPSLACVKAASPTVLTEQSTSKLQKKLVESRVAREAVARQQELVRKRRELQLQLAAIDNQLVSSGGVGTDLPAEDASCSQVDPDSRSIPVPNFYKDQSLEAKRQMTVEKIKGKTEGSKSKDVATKSGQQQPPQGLQTVSEVRCALEKSGVQCWFDSHSGFTLSRPRLEAKDLTAKMENKKTTVLSKLHLKGRTPDGQLRGLEHVDWVVFGVLVKKILPTKKAASGNNFSIWHLSDLNDDGTTISLFLFGKSYEAHWREKEGLAVGLLNPLLMDKKQEGPPGAPDSLSFKLDDPNKMLKLGNALEFAICPYPRKDGQPCGVPINRETTASCRYHLQAAVKKARSGRGELQSGVIQPRAHDDTCMKRFLKNSQNVMHGGRLYNCRDKIKVDQSKTQVEKADKRPLALRGAQTMLVQLQESANDNPDVDLAPTLIGGSQNFREKLLQPTSGSRNLIKHLSSPGKEPRICKTKADLVAEASLEPAVSAMGVQSFLRAVSAPDSSSHTARSTDESRTSSEMLIDLTTSDGTGNSGSSRLSDSLVGMTAQDIVRLKRSKQVLNIPKSNPNGKRSREGLTEKQRMRIAQRIERVRSEDGGRTEKRLKMTDNSPEANRLKMLIEKILNTKVKCDSELAAVEREAEEKYFSALEKKEKLETQMSKTMEVVCKVVLCLKCKYIAQSPADRCKLEHKEVLHWTTATKRFFECTECKFHTSAFSRYPSSQCSRCSGGRYRRVAMSSGGKGAPLLDSEVFKITDENGLQYLNQL